MHLTGGPANSTVCTSATPPDSVTVKVAWDDGTTGEVNAWTSQWTRAYVCVYRETAPPYHPFWVWAEDVRRRDDYADRPDRKRPGARRSSVRSSWAGSGKLDVVLLRPLVLVALECDDENFAPGVVRGLLQGDEFRRYWFTRAQAAEIPLTQPRMA